MKDRALTVLAVGLILGVGCTLWQRDPEEAPLLLEEPTEGEPAVTSEGAADNSRCHVCHFNYADETLAVTHANEGVGCEACHGESDAHCGDENNITPPEKMYPRDVINRSCMMCHPKSKLAAEAEEHKDILPEPKTAKKACTDCHGEHRLERRTVRWDKKTGKLLPKDQQPD